ncbi:type II toxin-antitoxin system VapC family toxin [Vibrio owensii]|uniref:type II toxin-antitoxin system VapC family toxin n=1 Tax=Vibrio owensii TaxID=696485 RepID=UPI0018F1E4F0|nr:hypothetical protein [Vibrio owensii]
MNTTPKTYMLDGSIAASFIKTKNEHLIDKFEQLSLENATIRLSAVAYEEIQSIAAPCNKLAPKSDRTDTADRRKRRVTELLKYISSIAAWDKNAVDKYILNRNELERRVPFIDEKQLMSFSHAQTLNAILITDHHDLAKEVEGLSYVLWELDE